MDYRLPQSGSVKDSSRSALLSERQRRQHKTTVTKHSCHHVDLPPQTATSHSLPPQPHLLLDVANPLCTQCSSASVVKERERENERRGTGDRYDTASLFRFYSVSGCDRLHPESLCALMLHVCTTCEPCTPQRMAGKKSHSRTVSRPCHLILSLSPFLQF